MRNKIKKIFISILRISIIFTIFFVIAIGLVLFNPMWLSSIASKELVKYGIDAKIESINSRFMGATYQLNGYFTANSSDYGIEVKKSNVRADFSWLGLLSGKPFIERFYISDGNIIVDREIFGKNILNNRLKNSDENINYYRKIKRIIPKNWDIENTNLLIGNKKFKIKGHGDINNIFNLNISDNGGRVIINYDKNNQLVKLNSEKLDIRPIIFNELFLYKFNTSNNFHELVKIMIGNRLDYLGKNASLNIVAKNNSLLVTTNLDKKKDSINSKVIIKENGISFGFSNVDLSMFKGILPLFPNKNIYSDIFGKVSGNILLNKQGIKEANLTFNNVGLKTHKFSFNNVYGSFHYVDNIFSFDTNLKNSMLSWPSQFPNGISPISGKLKGNYNNKTGLIIFNNVGLKSNDFQSIIVLGEVDLNNDKINLNATIRNVNLLKRKRIIPEITPKDTKLWLNNALTSGDKNYTKLKMKGHFKDFFKGGNYIFDLNSVIKNTNLHYEDGNPDINIKKAKLRIKNTSLSVNISNADIQGVPITGIVEINNLLMAKVVVKARFKNQYIKRIIPIAKKSVAKEVILSTEKIVSTNGEVSMDLTINIPIYDEKKESDFSIKLYGENLSIRLKDFPDVAINKSKIITKINNSGLRKLEVIGEQGGSPIKVEIVRDKYNNYIATTGVTDSIVNLLYKAKLINNNQYKVIDKQGISNGKSYYVIKQVFNKKGSLKNIKVNSSLLGTSLNLFGLVNKNGQSNMPLYVVFNKRNNMLDIDMGDTIKLKISFDNSNKIQGILLDNIGTNKEYKKGKAQFYWFGEYFDLIGFNKFKDNYFNSSDNVPLMSELYYTFYVNIKGIKFDENNKYPLSITGNFSNLKVISPVVKGKISYDSSKISANLSHLNVGLLFDYLGKDKDNNILKEINNIKLIPISISVDNLLYKNSNVGSLFINTSSNNGHYSVDQVFINGKNYFFDASGYEYDSLLGVKTSFQVNFRSENINQIIGNIHIAPFLDSKFIDITSDLSWPGRLNKMSLKDVIGFTKLNAQGVKLINFNAGISSIFGLTDFASVFKRLAMDFKNLSSSKIYFDTIKANWAIKDGKAITDNAYATGSLIDASINGAMDLSEHTFDNINLRVIPKASNVIPIVGAFSAGVIGATLGVLVQKVAGGVMDNIIGIPYVISGKWSNPIVRYGITSLK